MTRFKRLQGWPEVLERMSREELDAELRYWRDRRGQLGHRDAQKSALNNALAIEKVLARRFPSQSRDAAT